MKAAKKKGGKRKPLMLSWIRKPQKRVHQEVFISKENSSPRVPQGLSRTLRVQHGPWNDKKVTFLHTFSSLPCEKFSPRNPLFHEGSTLVATKQAFLSNLNTFLAILAVVFWSPKIVWHLISLSSLLAADVMSKLWLCLLPKKKLSSQHFLTYLHMVEMYVCWKNYIGSVFRKYAHFLGL